MGFFSRALRIIPACKFIKDKTPSTDIFSLALRNSQPETLLRTRHWQNCLPVKFAKFLRTLALWNICEGLLLMILDSLVKFNVH